MRIIVQEADFDIGAEVAALTTDRSDVGAVATFTGLVRDYFGDGGARQSVGGMTLEHYPGMTEKSLTQIARQATARWDLLGVTVIHRVGPLAPGDRIVFVAAASAHRQAAFDAANFIMDYLKTKAPFWKKEATQAGGQWVDAREADDAAAARWAQDAPRRD